MTNVKLSSGIVLDPNDLTSEDREAIVKALEGTKSGVWKPKKDESYWHIGNGDKIYPATYNPRDEFDTGMVSVGGAFPTEEAAEKHLTYLKALQVLRGDTKGYEWKFGERYYVGYLDQDDNVLRCLNSGNYTYTDPVKFSSIEDIEASFRAHTKEWRIVLGVE